MSSYETYYDEALKKKLQKVEEDIAQRKADDATLKEQYNAIIEQGATSAAGVYEQEISQAPLDSRALYDQNAITEAVNRKKISETLANMGMTDSGLASSMQTALTVQKARSDNEVRAAEQERISAAKSAIDQIWADAELQKSETALEIDQATIEQERTLKANAETLATEAAAAQYEAELEAQTKAAELAQEWQNKRATVAQDLIKKEINTNEAWAQAYAAYPDTSTEEGVRYAYYKQLRENGYGVDYAAAMSQAYATAAQTTATEAEVNNAVMTAMLSTAEEEVRKAGVNVYGGVVFGGGVKEKYDPTAAYAARIAAANMEKVAGLGMTDTAKMYATACMTGYAYAAILNDANAQKVGEALAQNFGGIYLEVALSYAGLE